MFQERWLRAQGKVDVITPDPTTVRTRWQRTGGVVSACTYWTSYLCSFTITYPIFYLSRRLPADNAAHRGFRAGGAAAAQDVERFVNGWDERHRPLTEQSRRRWPELRRRRLLRRVATIRFSGAPAAT